MLVDMKMMLSDRVKNLLKSVIAPLLFVCAVCLFVQLTAYKYTNYALFADSFTYTTTYDKSLLRGEIDEYRTPVYPTFAQVIKKIGGEEKWFENIVTVQKGLFFLSVIIFYFTLYFLIKKKYLVVVFSLLYGCCPFLFYWSVTIYTETLSILLFSCLALFTVLYFTRLKFRYACGIFAVLGLMVLTRPACIYLVPIYLLFFGIKIIIAKGKNRKIRYLKYSLSSCFCIVPILLFCSMMYFQHGMFGLSTVGDINDSVTMIDAGFYDVYDNEEEVEYINEMRDEEDWNFGVYYAFVDKYGKDEMDKMLEASKEKIGLGRRVRYYAKKAIGLSRSYVGIIYAPLYSLYPLDLGSLFYPFTFSTIFIICLVALAVALWALIVRRKLDWVLFWLLSAILGNLFVAIVCAPEETARLSLLSIPATFILVCYLCSSISIMTKRMTCTKVSSKRRLKNKES